MNALKITLKAEYPLRLPLKYNNLIQGALYKCLEGSFPELHDEGWTDGNRVFRMFTFGRLEGKYRIEGKSIVFYDIVRLEVRSPSPEIIEAFSDYLLDSEAICLGESVLPIINLEVSNRLLFKESVRIRMKSYLTIHKTDGRKTLYFSPFDAEFEALIRKNAEAKLRAADFPLPAKFRLVPEEDTVRKVITRFKDTIVEGYEGCFRLETSPEAMALLYYAGLGDRNSQGFGMFEIED